MRKNTFIQPKKQNKVTYFSYQKNIFNIYKIFNIYERHEAKIRKIEDRFQKQSKPKFPGDQQTLYKSNT